MNEAISKAVEHCGGASRLALAVGVTPPAVAEWLSGSRPVPIKRCVLIEQATAGAVRRWDLRPTDWRLVWPELIDHPEAPPLPVGELA